MRLPLLLLALTACAPRDSGTSSSTPPSSDNSQVAGASDAVPTLTVCGELESHDVTAGATDNTQRGIPTRRGLATLTRETSVEYQFDDTLTIAQTVLRIGETALPLLTAIENTNVKNASFRYRPYDGYAVTMRAYPDCRTAEFIQLDFFRVAPSAYRQPEWGRYLLDLSAATPELVEYPLARTLHVEPDSVLELRSVRPWTVARVVRDITEDHVDGPFVYSTGAKYFLDPRIVPWAAQRLEAGTRGVLLTDRRMLERVDAAFRSSDPSIRDSVKWVLRTTLAANQHRTHELVDGRYLMVDVVTYWQGNHPVLGMTHRVVLDLVEEHGWYLQMEWPGVDFNWEPAFPNTMDVHGSTATLDITSFARFLEYGASARFEIAYTDSALYAWVRGGKHYLNMEPITVKGFPWRCTLRNDVEASECTKQ